MYETIKNQLLTSINQLLWIAVNATDSHIVNIYGGEKGLIDLLERYTKLYQTFSQLGCKESVSEDENQSRE